MDFKQSNNSDNMHDFMSQVMGNSRPQQIVSPGPVAPTPAPMPQTTPLNPAPTVQTFQAPPQIKKSRRGRILVVASLVLVALGATGFLSRGLIASLVIPPSPFVGKVEGVGFPLYYPTKLPEGYKIELNSIATPDNGVVIFAMSNENGGRIHVTIQDKPNGINLAPLDEQMQNIREIATPYGVAKAGITKDNRELANLLTDGSWIIVNTDMNTLSDEEFNMILTSLVEAKE